MEGLCAWKIHWLPWNIVFPDTDFQIFGGLLLLLS